MKLPELNESDGDKRQAKGDDELSEKNDKNIPQQQGLSLMMILIIFNVSAFAYHHCRM